MAPRSVTPHSLPKHLIVIFQTLHPILIAIFLIQILNEFLRSTRGKFIFIPFNSEEIVNLISRKKNKFTDLINISVFTYKFLESLISATVSMRFNNSLSEGIFQECFKTAKIIPIFKSGDSNSTANYRPIYMFPFLSKMFEKLMCARLDSYLKSNNILYTNQQKFEDIGSNY